MKYIKEKILEEAKRRFPIGSKVKSLFADFIDVITNYGWEEDDRIWFGGNKYNIIVWENGKWAKRLDKHEITYEIY